MSPSHKLTNLAGKLVDTIASGVKNKLSQYNFMTNKNSDKFSEAKDSKSDSVVSFSAIDRDPKSKSALKTAKPSFEEKKLIRYEDQNQLTFARAS